EGGGDQGLDFFGGLVAVQAELAGRVLDADLDFHEGCFLVRRGLNYAVMLLRRGAGWLLRISKHGPCVGSSRCRATPAVRSAGPRPRWGGRRSSRAGSGL